VVWLPAPACALATGGLRDEPQAHLRALPGKELDFVSDQITRGQRFRILRVVADCTLNARRSSPIHHSGRSRRPRAGYHHGLRIALHRTLHADAEWLCREL
jgi:hypothetical protein